MKQIRVGLIGCGGIMNWHARQLLARPDATIVGLSDPSAASVERLVEQNPRLADLPVFAGYEDLFDTLELDAVEIASPHTLHYAMVRSALERGLHVLCEKPLACEAAHARELAELAEARGAVLLVSYQRHYDGGYRYMKRVLSEGGIGELRSASVVIGQSWKKGTTGRWRQEPELSGGGMLMDSASHLMDILLWLVHKPVRSVSAIVDNVGTSVDINTTAALQFEGGMQAQFMAIGDWPGTWIEDVLISGTEGVLRYQNDPQHPWASGNVTHMRDGELVQPLGMQSGEGTDANFLDAIAGLAQNESPALVAVRVAEVTEAIYRSARDGVVVNL